MSKPTSLHLRSIVRYYGNAIRRYKAAHVLILAGYGIGALCTAVVTPLVYKHLMDLIGSGERSAATFEHLDTLVLLLALSLVTLNMGFRVGDYCIIHVQSSILKELYDQALKNLTEKSYTFYTNAFAGGLVAKVKRFVRAFETLHDQVLFQLWMQGIELVASIIVLTVLSPLLGGLFVVWLTFHAVLVRFMVRWSLPKNMANAEADSQVTAHLSDIITNVLTVKMFGAERTEQTTFEQTTAAQDTVRKAAWMQNGFWNSMFQGVTINVFELVLVWSVVSLWKVEHASPGLVMIAILYVVRGFGIVWQISRNITNAFGALTDAQEMVELLDEPPSVRDPIHPEPVRIGAGHIEFVKVTHAYENTDPVFSGLSLTIRAGERVAFVGHSGAGKTTVVKLILRFLDITGGTIRIDGQDITTLAQHELRTRIAYVPQEPILFHRSLFENIAYGRPGASHTEVEEAARRAHAHDFIAALPHGYDTPVGERGVKLSGGERQRVAIARALLKKAPIVILDEATSSLDSVSEQLIREAFDELMRGKTTIAIAHRLSTIQHMDRIIVLDHGKVAEEGSHTDLIARQGLYAELWHSQVGGFLR